MKTLEKSTVDKDSKIKKMETEITKVRTELTQRLKSQEVAANQVTKLTKDLKNSNDAKLLLKSENSTLQQKIKAHTQAIKIFEDNQPNTKVEELVQEKQLLESRCNDQLKEIDTLQAVINSNNQDEPAQLKGKSAEIKNLKSAIITLEGALRDSNVVCENAENNLKTCQEELEQEKLRVSVLKEENTMYRVTNIRQGAQTNSPPLVNQSELTVSELVDQSELTVLDEYYADDESW